MRWLSDTRGRVPRQPGRFAAAVLSMVLLTSVLTACGKRVSLDGATTGTTRLPSAAAGRALASAAAVRVVGRYITGADGSVEFGYPGVTLQVCFRGTTLRVRAASSKGANRMLASMDGAARGALTLGRAPREQVLVQGAQAEGVHCVSWTHLTEAWIGTVRVYGFTTDGEFVAPQKPPTRRLLVIGDSVTCGEGVARPHGSCKKGPDWWDATASYGFQLGLRFGADTELVCYGGRGVVRDWRGLRDVRNAPQFFELALPDAEPPLGWDFQRAVPDVVVINLGTNDFSNEAPEFPSEEEFEAAYMTLLRRVRSAYPKAPIFITEGSLVRDDAAGKRFHKTTLQEALRRIVRRAATEGLSREAPLEWVALSPQAGDACDGHPTRAGHEVMARELAEVIAKRLGW